MPGCAGCDASCCRRYVVPISAADARRLTAATGRALEEFAVAFPDDEGFLVTAHSPQHSLALAKGPGGECVFLDERGLCSVYEHRPRTCRAYPAGVAPEDVVCPAPLELSGAQAELDPMAAEWSEHAALVDSWNAEVLAAPDRLFDPLGFFALVERGP